MLLNLTKIIKISSSKVKIFTPKPYPYTWLNSMVGTLSHSKLFNEERGLHVHIWFSEGQSMLCGKRFCYWGSERAELWSIKQSWHRQGLIKV